MGRYTVGGSGPVCKTGAYYARMVRAHLSPPSKYGRVAQLEERRKIIDSCKNSWTAIFKLLWEPDAEGSSPSPPTNEFLFIIPLDYCKKRLVAWRRGNADVAQLAERHSCKVRVVGSIPTVSSTKHICLVVYTDQPKSPAGANLGKCRIKSELRGICGIRIMASISGFVLLV